MKHDSALVSDPRIRRSPLPFARTEPATTPRVAVLLSLFDGERSVGDQLESLRDQTHANWSLTVRDDGSRDDGPDLVQRFGDALPDHDVRLIGGTHRGTARSYLSLIAQADPLADFAAFADQHSVWLPEMLDIAVARLRDCPADRPALYCAAAVVTDAAGRRLGRTPRWRRAPSFQNALAECPTPGTTLVVNRAALDLLRIAAKYRGPIPTHGGWCYQLVTGAGGTVICDETPRALVERPHRRAAGGHRRGRRRGDQAVLALRALGPLLNQESRTSLAAFDALRGTRLVPRLRALFRSGLHTQSRRATLGLWIDAALGRL